MKKILLAITFLGAFLPLIAMQRVPFELNFSDPAERAKWEFSASPSSDPYNWVIAKNPDYAYGDDYMLYMPAYTIGSQRTYYASYHLDTLPAGTYIISFQYRGIGYAYNTGVDVRISKTKTQYGYSGTKYSNSYTGRWWKTGTSTYVSDGKSDCYVYCYFHTNDAQLPDIPDYNYAIDAIQIYQEEVPPSCAQKPQSLQMTRSGNDAIVSWAGNASEYQLQYFMNDTSFHLFTTVDNITTTSYTIHSEQVPEGAYSFRVRAICGRDTSSWTSIDYQLIYDISKHCMDYLNFNHPDVKAQYGSFNNPGSTTGVKDEGFTSQESRHTIHHYPRDLDERTNFQLRTFPKGQPAAIRLGNWKTKKEAEDIIYTMQVTEDMAILQLRYALVMQLPGHDASQQPRFTLEFLDESGKLIDSCGFVDFTASANLEGWHTEHKEGETDVIWKDWSLIGLNMRDYIGRTVQVRITTKDCSEGAHFGYAYFTMGCSPGKIQGIHCGEKPDHFTVEEGFYYRWYRKYDPKHAVLSRERTFNLTDPMDTATYCVDMINMIDTACYFTMEASSLASMPHAEGEVKYVPSECKNYVQMSDASSMQGIYWDAQGNPVTVTSSDGAEEVLWDFGTYGTSIERSPKLRLPDSGDTLHVTLHAYMDNRTCEDTKTFDLVIPAVGTARTIDTYYFCHGGSITHAGKVYTEETDFSDTLIGSNGCDSISIVALRFFQMDTIVMYDTLCSGKTMEWYGQTLTEGGEYFTAVPSQVFDCDSVYNILYLHQQPYLDMALNYTQQHVCAGYGGTIDVPYVVTAGDVWTYDLIFSAASKKYGLEDQFLQSVDPAESKLTISLSDTLPPGVFDASIVFHNVHCDSLTFPITMAVYYDSDSLITQRWNDFLSVRKTAYDYYGGFTNYQWYRDDQPLSGQTNSQLYLPEEGLDTTSAYSVEMTRISDGVRVRTCPFYPTEQPGTVTITVYPTVVSTQSPTLFVQASEPAQIKLYGEYGSLHDTWSVSEGYNQLSVPAEQGLYLLYILTQSGEQTVRKIIVQ